MRPTNGRWKEGHNLHEEVVTTSLLLDISELCCVCACLSVCLSVSLSLSLFDAVWWSRERKEGRKEGIGLSSRGSCYKIHKASVCFANSETISLLNVPPPVSLFTTTPPRDLAKRRFPTTRIMFHVGHCVDNLPSGGSSIHRDSTPTVSYTHLTLPTKA